MNAVVEILNAAGQAFVEFALPMLIQSGVLILILLAVDAVLRRRVRAVFRYWIWMLVLVKLVLPPSLGSPVSVGTWFGETLDVPSASLLELQSPVAVEPRVTESAPTISAAFSPPDLMIAEPPTPTPAVRSETPVQVANPTPFAQEPPVSLDWQGLSLVIWSLVVFALTLLLIQRAFFVRGLLGQSEQANHAMLRELEDCRRRLDLRRAIGLRLSPNATSPAVCGLFRPVILIPQSIAPRLQSQDLQAVLLHELAHVKRGDLWINLAQTLLQIAYFYNPLLWLANAMIRRTREQAVDEAVLVAMGETASQYPETLINIAKLAFTRRPALSLRLIGVVESKSALTARIKHILTRPLPKTAKLGIFGLFNVLILAVVLLPMAKARPLPRPELDVVSPTEEQDRTVVEVPVSSDGVVTLPNGVTVEFLGLHDCGSKEDAWWRPDGEVLPEAPYGYSRHIRSTQPNQLYEVLFRVNSPTGRTFAKMECTPGRSSTLGFLNRDGGRRSRGLPDDAGDLFTGTLNRGSEANQVRIDLGVGLDNAWEPLGVLDGQASEAVTLADAVIKPAREEGGKTLVTVSHRIMDREVRLVAIDRNGSVHDPVGQATRKGGGIVSYEPRFELPLAEARQFRLEAQKLTWLTFDNVSLQPGQKTEARTATGPRGDAADSSGLVAKLRNGAVVELVGIRDCAGGDESWWRPDGEALFVAPSDSPSGFRIARPKTMYDVLFRVEAAAGKAFAEMKWSDGRKPVPTLVRKVGYGSRPGSNIARETDDLFYAVLYLQSEASQAQIDVGVGLDNAWETLGTLDGRASNATVTVPGAVIQPAREEEGKTVATVSHQIADRSVRLVAVDRHGFVRQPTKHSYGRGDDGGICEATFELPLAEIQEVRLEVQRLAWVTFQNVSLEAGKKTAVHVAVQSESSSDASVRAVVLPDVDRESKMLDLATGEILPLPQAGSPDEIWRAIGMLGRGDLIYDSNALILVRDAVSDQAHDGPTPPFKTYDIKPPLPVALAVTTAEGTRFEITILAADGRDCTLKYSRIPADRSAGGGAPVEPEKKGTSLEFRIAPKADELSSDAVEKQMEALLRGEHSVGGDFAWFETRPSVNLSPDLITCESEGKIHLLLSQEVSRRMPADGSWGLERVRETSDAVGRAAVDVALDERGAQRLGSFTKANVRQHMAVVFEGRVVAVPFIASPVSAGRLLITGRFADGEIADLIASLRKSIPIDPGGESHNETVSPGGESRGASIYMPDLEKRGADTVLDLGTRTFLSGEPMQRDPEYLDKLGKGDIAYEWANGRSGLLCFRGTKILEVSIQRPDGRQMTEAVGPDVLRREFEVYFIDAPRRYRVATARGEEYELNVISIDKGDSGGALVQIEKITAVSKSDVGESESGPQAQVPPSMPDKSLTTVLPNGVTVTLLGLFTGRDMERLEWWYPDGTPAPAERFVEFHRNYVYPFSSLFRYGYLIQFGVVPDMTVRTVVGVGAENRWLWHSSVPSFAFGLVMSDTPQFETELPSVGDIRVIVGTGAFKAVETSYKYGPIQDVLTLDDGHRLVVSTPQAQYPRGLGINVIADTDNLDLRLRSTLANNEVDIDGAHLDQRCQTGPLTSIDFRLTPDDDNPITRISLDYRPADVAHFQNVSLHRGLKADVRVEVRPAQAAKAATHAESEKTGGTLEFRIAPRSIDLDAGLIEKLKQTFSHGGGLPESDFAWFPIRMDLTGQPFAITHESGGKAYVLLWNKPPHVILASQDWGLESVYRVTDASRRPAIGLTFNDKGASLFHDLTAAHVQQNLAIVVEGTVVGMPNISAPLGRAAIIAGNFTEQEIEDMMASLRKGINRRRAQPGVAPVAQVGGGGEARIAPGTIQNVSGEVSGRVLDPEGNPAAEAQVALITSKASVTIDGGTLQPPRFSGAEKAAIVETDAEGRFRFENEPNDTFSLVAAHDVGFAMVGADAFTAEGMIRLEKWGRVEGQVAQGRWPQGDQIWMAGLPNETWLGHRREYLYDGRCDSQGRFAFSKVPPGWFEVGYLIRTGNSTSTHTSRTPVVVKSGETVKVTLGGEGRPVIGRFVPPAGYSGTVYFGEGIRSLDTERPEIPKPQNYDQMTKRQQQEWYRQWRTTPEYQAWSDAIWHDLNRRQYAFRINPDGTFRIEDVIAGKYDLTVYLERYDPDQSPPQEDLGGYRGSVEVPEIPGGRSDEPLDLGDLVLRMNEPPLKVGDAAPLFEAKTLDGRDIRLADYRGRFVLLSFWQPVHNAELDRLKALYKTYGADRLQIIGLGGNDTREEVESFVREHQIEWPEIYVGTTGNEIVKQYRLAGLPYIVLIVPGGKIVATWLRDEKLTKTVQEAIGEAGRADRVPLKLEYPDLPEPRFSAYSEEYYSTTANYRMPLAEEPAVVLVPPDVTNVARGKPVSSNSPTEPIIGDIEAVTDGDKKVMHFVEFEPLLSPRRPIYVTIDLGREYEIHAVAWWHDFHRPSIYQDVVVRVARDPQFQDAAILYNNDFDDSLGFGKGTDPAYVETNKGWVAGANGVHGRYVRLYNSGSPRNLCSQFTEVEVYGR